MVLTRAQRAQTTTEPEVSIPARATKAKTVTTTSKTTKAGPTSKKVAEPQAEEKKQNESKTVTKTSRATSITASAAAKSKPTKSVSKDEEEPKAKAAGRPRKHVQFSTVPEKKNETEESGLKTSSRGRPRKAALPTAASTARSTSTTKKTSDQKALPLKPTNQTAIETRGSARGRPRKILEPVQPAITAKDDSKTFKTSILGKPIRPKKAAAPARSLNESQDKENDVQTSSLHGPEPKLAPPIRASPIKSSAAIMPAQSLAVPALQSSMTSPMTSLGSPMRLGPRSNPCTADSPLRATPIRPLQSSLSQTTTLGLLAQPVFSNPVIQSPIRPSAKKPNNDQATAAKMPNTPLRSIGTPIRRKLNINPMALPFPQTAGPQKRSFIESPRRPQSARAPKRLKALISTPERVENDGFVSHVPIPSFGSLDSAKKTVSFQNSLVQERGDEEEEEKEEVVRVQSSSHQFHRVSAVTEMTEPEESVNDVFSINPTLEAMDVSDVEEETSNNNVETEEHDDISMSEMVGADFTLGRIYVPEDVALEAEPDKIQVLGEIEPLGHTAPFEDIETDDKNLQTIQKPSVIDDDAITNVIEDVGIGEISDVVAVPASLEGTRMADDILAMDVTQLVTDFAAEIQEDITSIIAESSQEMVIDNAEAAVVPMEHCEVESMNVTVSLEQTAVDDEAPATFEDLFEEMEAMTAPEAEDIITVEDETAETENAGHQEESFPGAPIAADPVEPSVDNLNQDLTNAPIDPSNGSTPETAAISISPVGDVRMDNVIDENTKSAAVSAPAKEPLTLLKGMNFIVDVWGADGKNASLAFAPLLEELGATVSANWSVDITHVLFKEGTADTLKKVVQSEGRIPCLNVRWAVE